MYSCIYSYSGLVPDTADPQTFQLGSVLYLSTLSRTRDPKRSRTQGSIEPTPRAKVGLKDQIWSIIPLSLEVVHFIRVEEASQPEGISNYEIEVNSRNSSQWLRSPRHRLLCPPLWSMLFLLASAEVAPSRLEAAVTTSPAPSQRSSASRMWTTRQALSKSQSLTIRSVGMMILLTK